MATCHDIDFDINVCDYDDYVNGFKKLVDMAANTVDPPKRPPTACTVFIESNWKCVKDQFGGTDEETSSKVCSMWLELSEEEKKPYFQLASEHKARYEREMKEYEAMDALKIEEVVKTKEFLDQYKKLVAQAKRLRDLQKERQDKLIAETGDDTEDPVCVNIAGFFFGDELQIDEAYI